MDSPSGLLAIDLAALIAAFWLALGLAGLIAPRSLAFVGRTLFPLGALAGLVLFGVGIAALDEAPQTMVLVIGLPDLPFHLRLDALSALFLALLGGKPGMKIDDATRFRMMQAFDPDAPPTLTAADILDPSYLPVTAPGTGYNAKTDLLGALFTGASRDNLLQSLRSQQDNVWAYQFNWSQEPAPWNDVYGSAHAFDLPFVFGNFGPSVFARAVNSRANQSGRLALSTAMMGSLGAFLRTGNPNNAALGKTWEPAPRIWLFDADLSDLRMGQK